MICRGFLHRDGDRQLDQLHLGGRGWSMGRALAVQHRHDRAQWRRFDGRVLLREQDHLPGRRSREVIVGYREPACPYDDGSRTA